MSASSLYSPLAQRLRETAKAMSRSDTDMRMITPLAENDEASISSLGKIIHLPRVSDPRGSLTFIEGERHVPFDIKRVFYLYDVPGGGGRGGHAHHGLHQFAISMAGSFDIILDNGSAVEKISLNRGYYGLHIPPMTWAELDNFSSGAVCLVLASDVYDESDYIRDYAKFRKTVLG